VCDKFWCGMVLESLTSKTLDVHKGFHL
jgi:hypothetical protein